MIVVEDDNIFPLFLVVSNGCKCVQEGYVAVWLMRYWMQNFSVRFEGGTTSVCEVTELLRR